MRRGWIRFLLTEKRLFRTPSYLLVLLALPVLVFAMRYCSSEDKGMLTIALCAEEPADPLALEVIDRLLADQDLLYFVECDDSDEAREMVEGGRADAAWILGADLEEKLREAARERQCSPVARILVQDDDVAQQFSREILVSSLFPTFLYDIYEDEALNVLELDIPESELRSNFEKRRIEGSLFSAEYPSGETVTESDYLLSPLRGMMAIWLVISGFAAVLYDIRDEQRGMLDHIPYGKRWQHALYLMAVILFNGGIALYTACLLSGMLTNMLWEALLLILFLGCTAVFTLILGRICKSASFLGALVPAVIILLLALSPVFFGLNDFWMVQMLLPTYLYLNALHGTFYAGAMAVYLAAGALLYGLTFLPAFLLRARRPGKATEKAS